MSDYNRLSVITVIYVKIDPIGSTANNYNIALSKTDTVGSANLSEFFSEPYRTATDSRSF
jgi:hypothetical protein